MTQNKLPKYDHAIFFRLARKLTEEQLKREIRHVKDMHVELGHRDFYIAFYELEFCPEGYVEGGSRYRMTLHEVKDQGIEERVRRYNPTHCLAIRQLQSDANFRRITQLAIDLYDVLGPAGDKKLDNLAMHFMDEDKVMLV